MMVTKRADKVERGDHILTSSIKSSVEEAGGSFDAPDEGWVYSRSTTENPDVVTVSILPREEIVTGDRLYIFHVPADLDVPFPDVDESVLERDVTRGEFNELLERVKYLEGALKYASRRVQQLSDQSWNDNR